MKDKCPKCNSTNIEMEKQATLVKLESISDIVIYVNPAYVTDIRPDSDGYYCIFIANSEKYYTVKSILPLCKDI